MSRRLSAVNLLLRRAVRPILARTGTPDTARRALNASTRLVLHGPGTRTRTDTRNGVPTTEFLPPAPKGDGTILYLHGGGYIAGSPATHRAMLSVLACETGLTVIAPDHRLAPEHPFPAAFDDCRAVLDTLDPAKTVLGGDSAGGGLALALLANVLTEKRKPAGCFAFSPWTDLAATGPSLSENARRDVILPVERMPELLDMVLAGADPRDPRISPLYADFTGAPPVQLHVGLTEILRDDTLRLAERMTAQSCDVTVKTLPHAPHVWQMLVGLVPEARASLHQTAAFVQTCLNPPGPPPEN